MAEVKDVKKPKNPIEALFDPDNTDPIELFNEKGEKLQFEQIAIVPKGKKIYAILRPIAKIEGLADDEALVFEVGDPNAAIGEYLMLVTDMDIIDQVFAVYDKLMDEEEGKSGKGNK